MVIIDSAKKITSIECPSKNITTIVGIEHFTNLTLASFIDNNISTIPDISSLAELRDLILPENEFSVFPDISGNTALEQIHFAYNHLSAFPDLHANPNTKYLVFSNNQMTSVPDLSYLTALSHLSVGYNPITSMAPVGNIESLSSLDFQNTKLTVFPDLTQCPHLTEIFFGGNPQFSEWPNLSANYELRAIWCNSNRLTFIPSLHMYPSLTKFGCADNRLTALPNLSALKRLEYLDCHANQLTSLPDLTATELGDSDADPGTFLNVSDNHLTFEDLIPVVVSKMYAYLNYESQTIPAENIKINKNTGDVFSYNLGFDGTVPDNAYQWYHNNLPFTSDGDADSNTLVIRDLRETHSGVYKCMITNSQVPGVSIEWAKFTLNVMYDPKPVTSLSDPVISPNNDGVADNYYIPHNGISKIYDRNGVLINELSSPGEWDGTDKSGAPVPMGTYVIVSDGQREIFITIVR